MENLSEMVTEALEEVKARENVTERMAFLEALDAYTKTVKEGLVQCGYQYEFKDEYVRMVYNGLTVTSAFKADLYTRPRSSTMLMTIGKDSQLSNRYRKVKMLIQALEEVSLDDLNDAVGENLQELEKKVNEAGDAYVYSRGDGSYAIKRSLDKILNRLTQGGQASVKFYPINLAHPDDEDIISQACDVKINVGGRFYIFKYVVPLKSKTFFDDEITNFCTSNDMSFNMASTMECLYTLKCCLEMIFNHVEILGSDDTKWYMSCHSDILDVYYKGSEILERFMAQVYMRRPDHNDNTYCFTNK